LLEWARTRSLSLTLLKVLLYPRPQVVILVNEFSSIGNTMVCHPCSGITVIGLVELYLRSDENASKANDNEIVVEPEFLTFLISTNNLIYTTVYTQLII